MSSTKPTIYRNYQMICSLRDCVRARSEWVVAAVTLFAYGLALLIFLSSGHDPRELIREGQYFLAQGNATAPVQIDPGYQFATRLDHGYDGQFCYYIALHPLDARYFIDVPSYRYTRIVYPLLARLLAAGQPALIPYTLVVVNCLAMAGGTLAVAAWLRRRGLSPWWALLYAFYGGLIVSVTRDLTEPLAYALAALGVWLFDFGARWRIAGAGLAFALAGLTRETTLLFPLVYGAALLWPALKRWTPLGAGGQATGTRQEDAGAAPRRSLASGVALLALAFAPFALYKLAISLWLGSAGMRPDTYPVLLPFAGLVETNHGVNTKISLVGLVAPAALLLILCAQALARRIWTIELAALIANILFCVVFLNASSYNLYVGSGRVATGVTLAALYCLPVFLRLSRRNALVMALCGLLWSAALPLFLLTHPNLYQ